MDKVEVFRTVNGVTLVGKVIDDSEWVSLKDPVVIAASEEGIGLGRVPFCSGTIRLRAEHILIRGAPEQNLLDAYIGATGGITVVPSSAMDRLNNRGIITP